MPSPGPRPDPASDIPTPPRAAPARRRGSACAILPAAKFSAAALGVAVVAGAGGCSTYASPELTLAQARVVERSPAGLAVAVELDARNINAVELPLREIRYSFFMGGKEVFRGVRSPEATLRRLGTQRLRIPAVIPLPPDATALSAESGLVPIQVRGTLAYVTPGQIAEILFDAGLRRPTVSFVQSGTLDLATPAPAELAAP